MKIKKGDQVLIISGKYRGKKGKVIRVLPKAGKIVVEKINLVKKHVRPKKSGEKGQVVEMPHPFEASIAKVICSNCKEATRIGFIIKDKNKNRACRKCGQEI